MKAAAHNAAAARPLLHRQLDKLVRTPPEDCRRKPAGHQTSTHRQFNVLNACDIDALPKT